MKKTYTNTIVLLLIFCISFAAAQTAGASDFSIQASSYINSYSAQITTGSGGRVLVDGIVTGTNIMDTIGVQSLVIQKYQSGYWINAITWSNLYDYSSVSSVFTATYYGSVGTQYRAVITYYAALSGGSDSRIMTTSSVTAVS